MKMFCILFSSLLMIFAVVSGQDCSEGAVQSRYDGCMNQFLNTFYSPLANDTTSQCSESKTEGTACINRLIADCSNTINQLPAIVDVSKAENAFQYACDSSYDVALARSCLTRINPSVQSCLEAKKNVINADTLVDQKLCLSSNFRLSCLTSTLQSECRDDSLKLTVFLTMYYPSECTYTSNNTTNPDSKKTSTCSDNVVMTNFTECVKPFFERIEKLNFDKEKCNESVLETLQCVVKVVAKCAQTEKFTYIQKLLDLQRTKTALDFGCAHDWNVAKGAFCYNKHYGSDIRPCLDIKMSENSIYSGTEEKTFETVCRYIDATTDCARTGMRTCKDEAVTFSQYVRRFFPDDCTDDKGSAATPHAILGLLTSVLLAHILL